MTTVRDKGKQAVQDYEVIELASDALMTTLILCSPILVVGAVVGIVVGLLQSVMQLHDQTLTFVPKLIAILAVLTAMLPWLMQHLTQYAAEMFSGVHY